MSKFTDYLNRLGNNEQSDECYTPVDSVKHLFPFLDKQKTYYEATSGKSSAILESFKKENYKIVGSEGKDFLSCTQEDVYDGVITNPPYSKKDAFIQHCYSLHVPFALLLPVSAIQGQKRGRLFKELGISILVYNRRVDFTGKGSPPFGVAWFMYGFGESNQLYFVDN